MFSECFRNSIRFIVKLPLVFKITHWSILQSRYHRRVVSFQEELTELHSIILSNVFLSHPLSGTAFLLVSRLELRALNLVAAPAGQPELVEYLNRIMNKKALPLGTCPACGEECVCAPHLAYKYSIELRLARSRVRFVPPGSLKKKSRKNVKLSVSGRILCRTRQRTFNFLRTRHKAVPNRIMWRTASQLGADILRVADLSLCS